MKFVRTDERLENFSNALTWLTDLTQVNASSRFYVYQKILKEIVDSSDLPNGGTSENQMDKIIEKYGENAVRGATLETDELIEIHNAFRNQPNIIPKSVLDKIVSGKPSEVEEDVTKSKSSEPRNILFELTVAATIQSSGLYVKLNDDADVTFNFRTNKVFFECKRFFREKNFESNLRIANEQLLNRYQRFGLPKDLRGISPIGFTCFSLTKMFNPKQLFLQTDSDYDVRLKIDAVLNELVIKHSELIRRKTHKNTVGMLFYTRVPIILPSGFGVMNSWKIFPLQLDSPKFHKICEDIGLKLKSRNTT
jgi:hypothetical protein